VAVILSFESARQRRDTEARAAVNFKRLLINHTPPSAGFLGVFQSEPTSRAAALSITVELGITAEPYSLTLPQSRGFRLDACTDATLEVLKQITDRSITRAVWRSPAHDLAWEGLPNVRGAVLNSLICLIQQLNGLDVPVWISEYVQISTGITAQRASAGFSRLELTLR
jgi:hypothetical protein